MKTLIAVLLLLPSMALAQGIQARPASAANPTFTGTVTLPSSGARYSSGPRISPDANTVCHIWFDGTAMQKTGSCAFTQVGTVPMVAASGRAPAGAGPFSASNYYAVAGGNNDPLDLSGANFTMCAIYKAGADASTETLFSAGAAADNSGYSASIGTQFFNFTMWGAAAATYTASHTMTSSSTGGGAGSVGVYCGGRVGTSAFAQFNFTAHTIAAAAAPVAGTGVNATVGISRALTVPAAGTLYEIWWTTTAPSKTLVDRISAAVLSTF